MRRSEVRPGHAPRPRLARWLTAGAVMAFVVWAAIPARAVVAGTKHDLSTNFNSASDQPCAYCHTPHFANTTMAGWPLWNRFIDLTKTFTLYTSATLNTSPEQPRTGSSILCLGCHDGTAGTAVVNGYEGGESHDVVNAPGSGGMPDTSTYPNCRRCHGEMYGDPPAFWQGMDLSNDHPIAMVYPTPAQDAAFNAPPDASRGWPQVPLFAGRVECASCHEPHDGTIVPFLRTSNAGSALCLTCHTK